MFGPATETRVRLVSLAVSSNVRIGIGEGQRDDRCAKNPGPGETGTLLLRKRHVPELLLCSAFEDEQRPALRLARTGRSSGEVDQIVEEHSIDRIVQEVAGHSSRFECATQLHRVDPN